MHHELIKCCLRSERTNGGVEKSPEGVTRDTKTRLSTDRAVLNTGILELHVPFAIGAVGGPYVCWLMDLIGCL